MPLVPLASQGRRGVLIHTSTPWTSSVGEPHVVVVEEHDVRPRVGPGRELRPLLDQRLALLVARMRLAGDDELNGSLGIGEQAQQARRIREQKIRSLVGGEAAGEAQRQRIRMEHARARFGRPRRGFRAAPAFAGAGSRA